MPGRLFASSRLEEDDDFYWTTTDMIGAAVIGVVFVVSGLVFVGYKTGFIRCPCWWVFRIPTFRNCTHIYMVYTV